MKDIHASARKLEAARRRLSSLKYGDLLLKFLDHLQALGLSTSRVLKYATCLCTIFKNAPFNPAEAEKSEVEKVVAWINSRPYRSWTKHGLKLTVKKLLQYAKCGSCHKKAPVPSEAAWIDVKADEKDCRVTPESLLTVEDVKAIIRNAENERDKALIAVLYEAALRPGELLTMKVGSVEFRDNYCIISVNGKTGIKRIPIVVSYKYLLDWLEKHPRKADPEAPLWASLSNNAKGSSISYAYLRKLLKKLAQKAGIKRDVWPYLFRHSSLTNMAKNLTESKLALFAGWTQGSKMTKRYVHFSARDLEETVLEIHGLKPSSKSDGFLKVTECPRCGRKNAPDAARCGYCGYVLDKELAIKIEEEERMKDEAIIRRIENLEKLVHALLNASPGKPASAPQALSTTFPGRTSG